MIRPASFGHNAETAASNAFQHASGAGSPVTIRVQARSEFDGLVRLLRAHGVEVCVLDDEPEPETPDALFPNNWVSFHADGTVVLYPMQAPNRRLELSHGVVCEVARLLEVSAGAAVHLAREFESRGQYLEGTGSLVLDRPRHVAYACLSPRTHPDVLAEFGRRLGYELQTFRAVDEAGTPIYHTNVLMALGEDFCVLCLDALPDAAECTAVVQRIEATGRRLIPISQAQLRNFAGNLLQVENAAGERFIACSTRALDCFAANQLAALERHGKLLAASIDTIETVGGGGVRCMLAEVFLPPCSAVGSSPARP